MSYRLEIRPEALSDTAEAASWFEEQQAGLGERFAREVIAAIDGLSPHPLLYRLRHRRLGFGGAFLPISPIELSSGLATRLSQSSH